MAAPPRLRANPTQKYPPRAKGDRYPRGVAEAIGLSIDAVTAADPTGLCADLLAVISLLSPEGVSRDLFHEEGAAGVLGGGMADIDEALSAVGTKACDLIATAFRLLGEPWQHRVAARDLVRQVISLYDHLAPHLGPADRALAERTFCTAAAGPCGVFTS